MADSGMKKQRIVEIIRVRQSALNCPYLKDYSDGVVLDILFTPGEQRLRVLQWLVTVFHPKLHDIFSTPQRQEGLVAKLSTALSWLGLCQPEDHELIKGTTNPEKQLGFLVNFLELVLIAYNLEDPFTDESRMYTETEKSCHYIDALCSREDLKELLPEQCTLFPPDVMKVCEPQGRRNASFNTSTKQTSRESSQAISLPGLIKHSEELAEDLELEKAKLSKLVDLQPASGNDYEAMRPQCKSLAVSLSTVSQLVGSFRHTYQEELHPWTTKDTPVFSDLGPAFKQIHNYVDNLAQHLAAMKQTRATLKELESLQPAQLPDKIRRDSQLSEVLRVLDGFLDVTCTAS